MLVCMCDSLLHSPELGLLHVLPLSLAACSWQCRGAARMEARLAVGTRSRHISVFDVTSHFTVTSDSLSTHVSEQLVCRAKVPIVLSQRILCVAWTESAVQGSKDDGGRCGVRGGNNSFM